MNSETQRKPLHSGAENPGLDLLPGLQLDDFVLEEKLGSGGMGEVWKAKQQSMNRDIALKILSPELSADKVFINRFLDEAVMTGKLRHPNIITAYTAGNTAGYYYLAMQYVDGIELLDKIKIDGMLPEHEALRIARIIASALGYAWEQHHMLHCDIKPGNIMIDQQRMPYLMDMGIARIVSEHDSLPGKRRTVVGSLQYMSPEQAAGDAKLDFRTDIYSLGATLYQMVTASLPFGSKTVETSVFRKVERQLLPPIERNPYLSPGCSALISRMMANHCEDRQSDWNYVIDDIDAVLAGTYVVKQNLKVRKWDAITAPRKNFSLNAPISLEKGVKSKAQPGSESATSTRKIIKSAVAPAPAARLPPVAFESGKERHSRLKLLILLVIVVLTVLGAGVYYLLSRLK
ncbi:MAG: serine/threonine-protein kinase [Victivallaceae bacterium]|nr:serine/threonine-protein kinase [Victivallaceae bacterium]